MAQIFTRGNACVTFLSRFSDRFLKLDPDHGVLLRVAPIVTDLIQLK